MGFKFANSVAWQQAELLMQPVFIRVIDNLRKQLDQSTWKGTYEQQEIWADDVTDETKATVAQLQQELKQAAPADATAIEQALAQLPQPQVSYQLHLQHQDQRRSLDLWQLCYQICFRNYNPVISTAATYTVEVDTSLIEDDTGEVDWNRLDEKAKHLIEQFFASLPPG